MAALADSSEGGTGDGPAGEVRRGSPAGVPRWVKVLAAVGLVLVAVAVVVALARGSGHGPALHAPLANPDRAASSGVIEGRTPSGSSGAHLPPARSHR